AVISGGADEDVRVGKIKVVPGDVHPPEEGRGWIVIGPARFSVVGAAAVNAEMGPAIWVPRSGGLVAPKAPTAATSVDPDREPGAGWFVVQNNRVAKGIVEGALTVSLGHAGEGGAAVGGDRCAGDVDGVGVAASRVVVGDNNL